MSVAGVKIQVTGVRVWWGVPLRVVLLVLVFACGFASFAMGVGVSDRAGVPDGSVFTRAYYALGLFVLGGMDLGTPVGGPPLGRAMLWFAYFAAPAITASALVEGLLRVIRPGEWEMMRMRGQVVIAGGGKLTMQYLERLREAHPRTPVVIVERRGDRTDLAEARDYHNAITVVADVSSDALLRGLRLEHASRVLCLTGDDFVNLDTASKVLALAPHLAGRIVAHVSDLHFMRVVEQSKVAEDVVIFNTHQIAAEQLVNTRLLPHFARTVPRDTVVIAGFGRFGQTVLDQLQRHTVEMCRVVLVDIDCARRALVFDEQVGFLDGYQREVRDGDLRDPAVWQDLEKACSFSQGEPVFVIGSGDDATNLHTAMWLKAKYPSAYVVARCFRSSAFAADVMKKGGVDVFSVAELLSQTIPDSWIQ
jgi:Trk K+ transport system NAD-binding subunit